MYLKIGIILQIAFLEKFYWLGGTDETTEGIWQWPNGDPIEFKNWAISAQTGKEPDNQGDSGSIADYMILYNSKWYDYNEEFSAHYICSKPGYFFYIWCKAINMNKLII